METSENAPETQMRYERSRLNFFGRRAQVSDTASRNPGWAAQEPSTPAESTGASAGRRDFPSIQDYRPVNLLGRSARE